MRSYLAAVIAAVGLLATPLAAGSQPVPGSTLTGVITTGLDSKTAYVGEDVSVNNVSSSDGRIRNARLTGAVTEVVKAGQGRPGKIAVHFTYLHLSNGRAYPIDGVVTSMQANTKNNTLKEVGGALGGMLIGNAIAKTVLGASGGGIVGAAGGYLLAKNNRADVSIPAGSTVTVQVVSARRQAS
jgi:hypothetical protein